MRSPRILEGLCIKRMVTNMEDFDIIWTRSIHGEKVNTSVLIRGLLNPLNLEYRSMAFFDSKSKITGARTYIGDWVRFS